MGYAEVEETQSDLDVLQDQRKELLARLGKPLRMLLKFREYDRCGEEEIQRHDGPCRQAVRKVS